MKNIILGLALLIAGTVSAQFSVSANAEYVDIMGTVKKGTTVIPVTDTFLTSGVYGEYNLTGDNLFKIGPKVGVISNEAFDDVEYLTGLTFGVGNDMIGVMVDGLYKFDHEFGKEDVFVVRPQLNLGIGKNLMLNGGYSQDVNMNKTSIKQSGGFLGLKYKF